VADRGVRWGVLGAAAIARYAVVPALQASTSGRVVAIASRDVRRARAFADDFGIDRVFDSYDALLAERRIDAVYIPLPNALHARWAIRAAEAGKAVLCEKPLATNAADAQAIVEACALHKVPLMEGFMYRFHPQNRRVRDLVDEGVIGEIREVRSHLSVRILHPASSANVRFERDLGGGALMDMGCYTVDVARMTLGGLPEFVVAAADFDERLKVDVSLAGILAFSGGRFGTVSCSFLAGGEDSYVLIGTRGTIEVPRAFIPGYGKRAGEGLVIIVDENGNRREERFAPVDQYRLMVDAFSSPVLTGEPPPYRASDSVDTMRILDALGAAALKNESCAVA